MKTLFTFLLTLAVHLALAQISITRPIQNSVLQRNNINTLSFTVAGQLLDNNSQNSTYSNLYPTIQYRIQKLSPQNSAYLSTPINWTSYSCGYGGLFDFAVILEGGWYQLDIQGTIQGNLQTASVKFGIGEVFIIAGQSNAQGVTGNLYNGSSPYDGVVADLHLENSGCISQYPLYPSLNKLTVGANIAPQGQNNWCYTVLGNQLVNNTGVPVAFFNAAQANTGVRNWVESIQNSSTTSAYGQIICQGAGAGHPYIALKKTMQFYGSLFGARSILWHQGENDAHDANFSVTNGSDYITRLRTVIGQARSDFGHSDLSWWICKVSRTDPTSETVYQTNADILSAQGTVQADNYNKAGPYTDGIGPRNDFIHFSGTGLRDLGDAWYNSIGNTPLTSATPATPNAALHITLTGSYSSGFNLMANGGFSQYFWIDPSQNRLDPALPTGQNVYNASGGASYICYAQHPNGQWYISQVVRVPYVGGSARLAVKNSSEPDEHLSYNVYPNPATDQTTISFTLSSPANVNLVIVDVTGRVVKQLANGHHAEGHYTYSVVVSQFPMGMYLCNLTANDLHLSKRMVKQDK